LPHKLWAIIPAAGSGSRFSQTELKQYQMIGQKTVLEHTVLRLNQLPLQGYVLAIGSDDDVAQSLPFTHIKKAHFCEGGAALSIPKPSTPRCRISCAKIGSKIMTLQKSMALRSSNILQNISGCLKINK
jgi:hypothetical protein